MESGPIGRIKRRSRRESEDMFIEVTTEDALVGRAEAIAEGCVGC